MKSVLHVIIVGCYYLQIQLQGLIADHNQLVGLVRLQFTCQMNLLTLSFSFIFLFSTRIIERFVTQFLLLSALTLWCLSVVGLFIATYRDSVYG